MVEGINAVVWWTGFLAIVACAMIGAAIAGEALIEWYHEKFRLKRAFLQWYYQKLKRRP